MEGKHSPVNKLFFICFAWLVAATLPFYSPAYVLLSITSILMYVTLTVSWTIFCGPTGYISLATATFFGIGIYCAALLGSSLPAPAVVLCGGLAGLAFGVLVGLICLRLSGFYFAVFTFGLSELVRHSVLWWEHNVSGTVGRWVTGTSITQAFYSLLVIASLSILAAYLIRRSIYGMALKAIGESEEAAEHAGINVVVYRIAFFAISSFFMGMAGAAMAAKFTYIDPNSAFNPLISFTPVLMSLFGGIERDYGPILGAFILTFISEVLLSRFPYFYTLIYGIIFVVVILFMPRGLAGLLGSGHQHKFMDH
ncbi:MAG: branched-chain amino acid ABC transporter permease [Deltaproteobacteria bacterium]|nr:branched-chain amino acid ABC transporter permease [Deltaproteobacteria bacterium]MBW2044162.1 branched-chain amino acid ABC transporter permease [Deltaproteobacteria bacterium]MBW2300547.1 branched-chain amino acid ABC transporter permease [Deltaproteobacteria bacterium]